MTPQNPVRKIAIVGCSKEKAPCREAQAQIMYCSTLFRLSAEYAKTFDAWYILSARYGLLKPTHWIKPYDLTLRDMSAAQHDEWAERCQPFIREIEDQQPTVFVILAGGLYFAAVWNRGARDNVEVPLAGLGIGQRMAWLKRQLAATAQADRSAA